MGKLVSFIILTLFILPVGGDAKMGRTAYAQWEQRQDKHSRSPVDEDADLSIAIKDILEMERQSPTTPRNVEERYRSLISIVSRMIRMGRPVRDFLPNEEGQKLESLIKAGNKEEAAQLVHSAIMRLERSFPQDVQAPFAEPKRIEIPLSPSCSLAKINIHNLANHNSFGNILKLFNPVIDSAHRRLYISGAKSTYIGVVDLDKDELIEVFDTGRPGGFLIFDSRTTTLYSFEIGTKKFHKIDIAQKKAIEVSSLPPYLSLPKKGSPKTYKGYTYKDSGDLSKVGYLQNENATYGLIKIKDTSGKVVGEIKHGPEGLHFAIDQKTGKLYATNTGDGSITVFDLNNQYRKVKDIDVGTSIDEIILNPKTGDLYIRNRLGGSTIFYYDPDTKIITTIPNENTSGHKGIGMWPTQIIYDDNRLYVLSHYGGRIDVIDTMTNKVVSRIPLNLSYKPRTDGISTMVMDKARKMLYAAFPELGELAIVDAKALRPIKVLQIEGFDTRLGGPGRIVLAVDEKLNKVFAYLSAEKTLLVYEGERYTVKKRISIDVGRGERIITSNAERGILYAGNKILDASTLQEKGSFPKGRRVIAFDNAKGKVYLAEALPAGWGKMVEKVFEYEGLTLKKEWTLSPILSIPSSFAFDFTARQFYVGYFESAVVEIFDLSTGEAPGSAGTPQKTDKGFPELEERSLKGGQRPGGLVGPLGGRCGDGICGPVEKEKGVCPEDCK